MSEKTLSVAEARRNLLKLIHNSTESFDRYILTKNGKPEVVLLNYEDYQSLMETLDVLGNPSLVNELERRKRELEEGKAETKHHFEVFKDSQ